MNAFVEHHKNSIQFGYRCFDRLLLNGLIQPFQQPERVLGFFNTYREGKRVTRKTLTEIADQFQYWLKNRSEKWAAPILEPPEGDGDESRRDRFLDAYFVMPLNRLPDSLTPFPVWFFRFDSVRRAEPAARVGSGWDRILACVGKTEYPTLCEGL